VACKECAAPDEAVAAPGRPSVKPGKQTREYHDVPRAPLLMLRFSFDAPVVGGAVLRQLGHRRH